MYPALGLGVIYLRHKRLDPRIAPGRLTTAWLWFCGVGLAVISPGGVLLAVAIDAGWLRL